MSSSSSPAKPSAKPLPQSSLAPNPDPASTAAVRAPASRPVYKLSVDLIDTYKRINKVYYEQKVSRHSYSEREQCTRLPPLTHTHITPQAKRKASRETTKANDEYDDENYDYIVKQKEAFGEGDR